MLEGGEDYEEELKVLEDDANLPVEELRRRYYGADKEKDEDYSSCEAQSSSTQAVDDVHGSSVEILENPEEVAGINSGQLKGFL